MSERTDRAKRFLDAYNTRDWDTMLGLCADNTHFYDNSLGVGGTRKEEMIGLWKSWTDALSDEQARDVGYIESEAQRIVITPLSFVGTHNGVDYLPGLKANGKQTGIRACVIWRFDEQNRIIGHEYFWDMVSPLLELGHIPEPALIKNLHPQTPPKVGVNY